MKTTLTLEIEYEVDGEMPPLEQVLTEISEAVRESIPPVLLETEECQITTRCTQELPSGWIPCDADNPPPAEIPEGMLMAVWYIFDNRVMPKPLWTYNGDYQEFGVPGYDFTHYMLVEKPK